MTNFHLLQYMSFHRYLKIIFLLIFHFAYKKICLYEKKCIHSNIKLNNNFGRSFSLLKIYSYEKSTDIKKKTNKNSRLSIPLSEENIFNPTNFTNNHKNIVSCEKFWQSFALYIERYDHKEHKGHFIASYIVTRKIADYLLLWYLSYLSEKNIFYGSTSYKIQFTRI